MTGPLADRGPTGDHEDAIVDGIRVILPDNPARDWHWAPDGGLVRSPPDRTRGHRPRLAHPEAQDRSIVKLRNRGGIGVRAEAVSSDQRQARGWFLMLPACIAAPEDLRSLIGYREM